MTPDLRQCWSGDATGHCQAAAPVPDAVWRMLDSIRSVVDQFAVSDAVGTGAPRLALAGSLAAGTGDAVSDIDLDLLCADIQQRDALHARVDRCLRDAGAVLAQFPATHIGLPELVITFVDVDGILVKVDVRYRVGSPADAAASAPSAATVLAGLHHRFTGWLWYTHTRIVRGEYWDAADSIAVMRAQALLPMLLYVHDLPSEGYRRIETRLAPAELYRLAGTWVSSLQPAPLRAALSTLCDLFETVTAAAVAKIGRDFRAADLSRMRDLTRL